MPEEADGAAAGRLSSGQNARRDQQSAGSAGNRSLSARCWQFPWPCGREPRPQGRRDRLPLLVTMKRARPISPPTVCSELIINGGFEATDLSMGSGGHRSAAELLHRESVCRRSLLAAGHRGQRQPGRRRQPLPGHCPARFRAAFHAQFSLLGQPRRRARQRRAAPGHLRSDDRRAPGAAVGAALQRAVVAVPADRPDPLPRAHPPHRVRRA